MNAPVPVPSPLPPVSMPPIDKPPSGQPMSEPAITEPPAGPQESPLVDPPRIQ